MSEIRTKIIITGGHITPALAVIKELQKQPTQILFLGRAYTDENKSPSVEKKLVEKLGVNFVFFDSPKFIRGSFAKNIKEIRKLPVSLYKAAAIIKDFKPNVILTFGGYTALPVAVAGFFQDIPIVTHEQTSVVGLANKLIEPMAAKLALSWPQTKTNPKRILVGNPVREDFISKPKTPSWYKNPNKLPLIYFTGGNQGSKAINTQINFSLESLSAKYYLVIQTGSTRNKQDFAMLSETIAGLPPKHKQNIYLSTWFDSPEAAWLIKNSDLVVGRSGANTATEILVSSANSVLIPLPTSAGGEQLSNAKLLAKLGLSEILPQERISDLEKIISLKLTHKTKKLDPHLSELIKLHTQSASRLVSLTVQCAAK